MGTCCATPNHGGSASSLGSTTLVEAEAKAKLEDEYGLDDLPVTVNQQRQGRAAKQKAAQPRGPQGESKRQATPTGVTPTTNPDAPPKPKKAERKEEATPGFIK